MRLISLLVCFIFFSNGLLGAEHYYYDLQWKEIGRHHARLSQTQPGVSFDFKPSGPSVASVNFHGRKGCFIAFLMLSCIVFNSLPPTHAQVVTHVPHGHLTDGVSGDENIFAAANMTTTSANGFACEAQARDLRATQAQQGIVLPAFVQHYTHPGIYSLPTGIETADEATELRLKDYKKLEKTPGFKLPDDQDKALKILRPRWQKMYKSYGPNFGNDDPVDRSKAVRAYNFATKTLFPKHVKNWNIDDLTMLNKFFSDNPNGSFRNGPMLVRITEHDMPGFFKLEEFITYLQKYKPEHIKAYTELYLEVTQLSQGRAHLKQSWDVVINDVLLNLGTKSPHYEFLKHYYEINYLTVQEIKAKLKVLLSEVKQLFKKDPIEAAAHFHMGLVNIHPWKDANGRVARTGANLLLIKGDYPAIPFTSDERYTAAIMAYNRGDKTAFVRFFKKEICRTTGLFYNPEFQDGRVFEDLVQTCKIGNCEEEFDKLRNLFNL